MDTPNLPIAPNTSTITPPVDPYKEVEFDAFLKNIGNAKLKTWTVYAKVLGVDRRTIERWKKHPLAQVAIIEAISENLEAMEVDGKGDWRMRREKLKILGVDEETIVKISPTDIDGVIGKVVKTNYDELSKQLSKQGVAPNQPVQDKGQTG
jgi:hypothetical protein